MKRAALLVILIVLALIAGMPNLLRAQESDPARATLESLTQIDDFPLYTMTYFAVYDSPTQAQVPIEIAPGAAAPAWACSLFAAFADPGTALYGRNFDWQFSPALLLFTDPPDGYASVSMVDIAYLGFASPARARAILDLPVEERESLLDAPYLPFDGMNEAGLVVGMAAVPPGNMRPDPAKDTVGSLGVIRLMLDHARTVDEAIAIIQNYNIDMEGGPPIHYLIADTEGTAALVEFYRGALHVTRNTDNFHHATNFLVTQFDDPKGRCWRYDRIAARLGDSGGQIDTADALGLLADVAQNNTQWSIVYGYGAGTVDVVMGRDYDAVHTSALPRLE